MIRQENPVTRTSSNPCAIARASTPEVRLNLLLAHPRLPPERLESARALVREIEDPDHFVSMAARKFSLPTISRYLGEIGFNDRFPQAAAQSKRLVLFFVTHKLKQMAALRRFQEECVGAAGVDAIYFKGPTLDRFYGSSGARFFRDIDLLVEEDAITPLVNHALERGYRVVLDAEHGVMASSEADIRAARRYLKEITLLSESGLSFEIHHRVDRHISLFDTSELMKTACDAEIEGMHVRTFADEAHFVYLCYHSCRHMWSHMHWVADLNAIVSHSSFDRDRCLREARTHGLERCVEASLGLLDLCADPMRWDRIKVRGHAEILLEACIENLQGNHETEISLRKRGVGPGPDWRAPVGRELQFRLKEHLFQASPKITQYTEWPLPEQLQWLYYFTRPIYAVRHKFKRRGEKHQE